VREMFRIADGEELGYDDPPLRGHSIEFRINAEDAGRSFMPAPGTISAMRVPAGPGVRLDGGYEVGDTVPQAFDSLIAKLVVTGRDRQQALERSRRALAEYEIGGMPTVIPFHRAVVADPAFAPADPAQPFSVHTRWIETEFDNTITPFDGAAAHGVEEPARQRVTVEVGGKRLEVVLPAGLGGAVEPSAAGPAPRRASRRKAGAAVFYRISDPAIFELCNHVCGSLKQQIKREADAARLMTGTD